MLMKTPIVFPGLMVSNRIFRVCACAENIVIFQCTIYSSVSEREDTEANSHTVSLLSKSRRSDSETLHVESATACLVASILVYMLVNLSMDHVEFYVPDFAVNSTRSVALRPYCLLSGPSL